MDANDEHRLLTDWAEYNVPAELLAIPDGVSPLAKRLAQLRPVTAAVEWPFPAEVLGWSLPRRAALP